MARKPPAARSRLTRETILAAALALFERDGLAAFSVRRLGASLGCEPMSLYHYFRSKAKLFDALVDDALAGVVIDPTGRDPIERLRVMARSYLDLARRHSMLVPLTVVHRQDTPAAIRIVDELLPLVRAAVPDDRRAAQFVEALHCFLTGATARYRPTEAWENSFELGLESLLDAMRAASPPAGVARTEAVATPKPVIHPKR